MPTPLTEEEFGQVMRFCRHFVLDDWPPCFDLRALLTRLLGACYPDTARKLAGLDMRQTDALCLAIVRRQATLRWGAAGAGGERPGPAE